MKIEKTINLSDHIDLRDIEIDVFIDSNDINAILEESMDIMGIKRELSNIFQYMTGIPDSCIEQFELKDREKVGKYFSEFLERFNRQDPIEVNKRYSRRGDMDPENKMYLLIQEDGDIIIDIPCKSLEFCTSGGRSPHTRKALRNLIDAIIKDNEEGNND